MISEIRLILGWLIEGSYEQPRIAMTKDEIIKALENATEPMYTLESNGNMGVIWVPSSAHGFVVSIVRKTLLSIEPLDKIVELINDDNWTIGKFFQEAQ